MKVSIKEVPLGKWNLETVLATENKGTLFLFGDNFQHRGTTGTASIRSAPNSAGIPLRYSFSKNRTSLFEDDDFKGVESKITQSLRTINIRVLCKGSPYTAVGVPKGRVLEWDFVEKNSPTIFAFLFREWTTMLREFESPTFNYRSSPMFPPMDVELRKPKTQEDIEAKAQGAGNYKKGVYYFQNSIGKYRETKKLEESKRIHSVDVTDLLKRHTAEWGTNPKPTIKETQELLDAQFKEISSNPAFRGAALDNKIIGWIGPLAAPILLIRKFPSYYAIRNPKDEQERREREDEKYGRQNYVSVGRGGRSSTKVPHETELVRELYARGLPKSISVCVAFVVPYRPPVEVWEFEPPPAQVTKFTPYLKYLMASMRGLKYLVVMDKWCAQFVINAKLNYNSMRFADSTDVPSHGEATEKPIKFYPKSGVRTMNASAYAVFLPHPFHWKDPKKAIHAKEAALDSFKQGIEAINKIVKPRGVAINPIAILMAPHYRKRKALAQEVDSNSEPEGLLQIEEEEEKEEEEEDTDSDVEIIEPISYDERQWVVQSFKQVITCGCTMCGGCHWKRNQEEQEQELVCEESRSREEQCVYCFCFLHGVHRDLDWNECSKGCTDTTPKY